MRFIPHNSGAPSVGSMSTTADTYGVPDTLGGSVADAKQSADVSHPLEKVFAEPSRFIPQLPETDPVRSQARIWDRHLLQPRLPTDIGPSKIASLHLDVLEGTDESIDVSDVFPTSKVFTPFEMRIAMEKSL